MKLIVQIPCYNEEHILPQTVADIPREIDGVDEIELVVDDGSTNRTVEVAGEPGVNRVVRNKRNMGLARTFRRSLNANLHPDADITVNTDGDNQYAGEDYPKLILNDDSDIVVGDRQTSRIAHFSQGKKLLQWRGAKTRGRSGSRQRQRIPRVFTRGRNPDQYRLLLQLHDRARHSGRKEGHRGSLCADLHE